MKIIKQFLSWIEKNPGYVLNIGMMGLCIGYCVFRLFSVSAEYEAEKWEETNKIRLTLCKAVLNANDIKGDSKESMKDNCGICVFTTLYKDAKIGAEKWNEYKSKSRSGIKTHRRGFDENMLFFHNVGINRFIEDIFNGDNRTNDVFSIFQEVHLYAKNNEPFIKNINIILIWILFTIAYMFLVFFVFKSDKKYESILNIIDIGIYLSLIQFAGGFNVHWILSSAIIIGVISAIVAGRDIRNEFIGNFDNSWKKAKAHTERLEIIKKFSPCIFYLFSLTTGLIWATISYKYKNQYVVEYFYNLGIIVFFAVAGIFIFHIFNKTFNNNNNTIQNEYN